MQRKSTILFLLLSALALSGCRTVKEYVPVETVRTEYVEADTADIYNRLRQMFESMRERETRNDSLIDRSKETVVINERGDTARYDRERIVYRSTNREKELEHVVSTQDSIINALRLQLSSAKADSVPVPYSVERKLTRWERTKQDYGGYALSAVATALCVAVAWLARKIKR